MWEGKQSLHIPIWLPNAYFTVSPIASKLFCLPVLLSSELKSVFPTLPEIVGYNLSVSFTYKNPLVAPHWPKGASQRPQLDIQRPQHLASMQPPSIPFCHSPTLKCITTLLVFPQAPYETPPSHIFTSFVLSTWIAFISLINMTDYSSSFKVQLCLSSELSPERYVFPIPSWPKSP